MDKLEIDRIEYDIRKKLGWIDFFVYVKVNDVVIDNVLDISEFAKAIHVSGTYPLFTCTCRSFGCSGFYVDIEVDKSSWMMKNRYAPGYTPDWKYQRGKLIEEVTYQIPWLQVKEVGLKIASTLRQSFSEAPPHVGTEEGLLAELEAALSTLDARL